MKLSKNQPHKFDELLLLTKQGSDWQSNFQPEDLPLARRLVKGLTLVSLSQFDRIMKELVLVESKITEGPVAVFAVREIKPNISYFVQAKYSFSSLDAVGRGSNIGSEGILAKLIRDISRSQPHKILNHPTKSVMRDKKCRAIVVVDDILGSGNRVSNFLNSIWFDRTIRSWWSRGYFKFKVIVFTGTQKGIKRVESANYLPTVKVNRGCPTFHTLPWPKYEKQRILNLCEKYSSMTSKPQFSLGYGNIMSSIIFEHGCPNNTPAILWAPSKRNTNWSPLFPCRSLQDYPHSVFPPEFVRGDPISVLIEAGQPKLANANLQRLEDTEVTNLMLLALIAKGIRNNDGLTFATGLSNADLELKLSKFITSGHITQTRRISSLGRAELANIRRRKHLDSELIQLSDELYYPRMLRAPKSG